MNRKTTAIVLAIVGLGAATSWVLWPTGPGAEPEDENVQSRTDIASASTNDVPAPSGAEVLCPHPFVPVGRGARWRYRTRSPDGVEVETTLRVESTVRRGEGYEVRYRGESRGTSREYVQTCSDESADEPWGLAAGAELTSIGPSWQVRARHRGEVQTAVFSVRGFDTDQRVVRQMRIEGERVIHVVGRETVDVPAGRFDALHVSFEERRTDTPDSAVRLGDHWLAEGVGLVRATARRRDGTLLAEQELMEVVDPA